MSRIGRMPIAVPAGVTVDIAENNHVTVKGPKGTLERTLPSEMDIKLEGDEIIVTRPNDLKKMKSLHGLTRTLINNMVVGVTNGYTKELEVNGVGYRASKAASLYKAFPPSEARRIIKRLEIHYTPKHGSWLDMAEIELNVMTRQCLSRRISTLDKLKCELSAWEMERNRDTAKIQWHFQTGDAREKLISLYPTLSSVTF